MICINIQLSLVEDSYRVYIARALSAKPRILILDEPLSSLDVSVQAQILNLLLDLKERFKLTCILVSHDLRAVYYLSDKVLVMRGGQLVEKLDDVEKFESPKHPYTIQLLKSHEFLKTRLIIDILSWLV